MSSAQWSLVPAVGSPVIDGKGWCCHGVATVQLQSGLLQTVEDCPIQALVPQLCVETLVVPILPPTARFDEQGWAPTGSSHVLTGFEVISSPLSERMCRVCSGPAWHQTRFRWPSYPRGDVRPRSQGKLARALGYQRNQAQAASVRGSVVHKVARPTVVWGIWALAVHRIPH